MFWLAFRSNLPSAFDIDCVRIHHVISPSEFDIAPCRQQLLSTGPKAVQISEIQDANRSLRMCFCYRTFLEIVHTCPHVLEEKSRWLCHWFVWTLQVFSLDDLLNELLVTLLEPGWEILPHLHGTCTHKSNGIDAELPGRFDKGCI